MEWLLGGAKRVGMQYSPGCAVPYVSLVDGGTLEAIRGYGVEVVSSGDLVQMFESRWDSGKLESHLEAGRRVDEIRRGAFELIREALASGRRVTECGVRDWILERFREEGLVTDHSPIVGVNEHAADPHYEPMEGTDREIGAGDVVLIDLWAKMRDAGSVYYDITWTGFGGTEVPEKVEEVFRVVTAARDAAVELAGRGGVGLRGFEVDDAARGVIERAGYGEWFVHRTGHSIGEEVHGSGANMDNLETHETRQVLEGTCFSVEPGIYLEGFGIRSEVNVFMGEGGGRVTGEIQRELVRLAG
jgi:Xaa-Pro aminopeptidase